MAYTVTSRTREIGIRIALGARGGSVIALVLRSAAIMVAVGLALGIAGAVFSSELIEPHLFGVEKTDLLTYTGIAAGFVLVALMACLLPAWRAARVDPVHALGVE